MYLRNGLRLQTEECACLGTRMIGYSTHLKISEKKMVVHSGVNLTTTEEINRIFVTLSDLERTEREETENMPDRMVAVKRNPSAHTTTTVILGSWRMTFHDQYS